jgi:arsenate reductase-like glutaredoxin family protein
MPAVPAPPIVVFGLVNSRPTRAALRSFSGRRTDVHFVGLRKKPIAPAELRRFVARLGARACTAGPAATAWTSWLSTS